MPHNWEEAEAVALEFINQPGGAVWVADAPDWIGGARQPLKIGITTGAIRRRAERGQRYLIGQLYGVLGPGLIFAQHVFQGLKRDMLVRGDSHADVNKLAITWRAERDARFVGDPFDGRLEYLPAPNGTVFVVYVSPNKMLHDYPLIVGWAEHWAWIVADPDLPGAPVDSATRYEKRLWSRNHIGEVGTEG